jgi:hypothetical protein
MSVYRQKGFCVISSSRQILLNILDGDCYHRKKIGLDLEGCSHIHCQTRSHIGVKKGVFCMWNVYWSSVFYEEIHFLQKIAQCYYIITVFDIKVTKKEEFEFFILCPILNAFFLFKMLIIICYRWTLELVETWASGRILADFVYELWFSIFT